MAHILIGTTVLQIRHDVFVLRQASVQLASEKRVDFEQKCLEVSTVRIYSSHLQFASTVRIYSVIVMLSVVFSGNRTCLEADTMFLYRSLLLR